jgi:hypothetical protein
MTSAVVAQRPEWPWPGKRDATARARLVAHFVFAALEREAPATAAEVLELFGQLGEDAYLMPQYSSPPAGGGMTAAEVSELSGKSRPVVRMWATRGIVRDGQKVRLQPGADGLYDADRVDRFLRLLDDED